MSYEQTVIGICTAAFIGLFLGMVLIAYEDGFEFVLWKKLRCKVGLHKNNVVVGGIKIQKYFCQFRKKPRKYPDLKHVYGGKKFGNNKFKF